MELGLPLEFFQLLGEFFQLLGELSQLLSEFSHEQNAFNEFINKQAININIFIVNFSVFKYPKIGPFICKKRICVNLISCRSNIVMLECLIKIIRKIYA